jgi:hypothetical protein
MWDENNYMCFLQPHSTLLILTNQHSIHQRWHSHLSQHYHCWPNKNGFTFPILRNWRIYCSQCSSNKTKSYHDWHPTNQFLPLTIEIFGCLHKHVNVFIHNYANANWSMKGPKGLHFMSWFFFSTKHIKRMQTSLILSQTIAVGLIIS